MKINSSQAQGPGGFCHCLWSRKKACYQLTLFLCPQCSPCRRQIYFLFTNKAATLLSSNPSDELWMLPGLIFIISVTKKDQIFPLHPHFTELQQQKQGLGASKFSCHLKTNSPFFPLPIFPHPWGSSRTAFPSPWDVESSWLGPKRGSEKNTNKDFVSWSQDIGRGWPSGGYGKRLICNNCSTDWRGI